MTSEWRVERSIGTGPVCHVEWGAGALSTFAHQVDVVVIVDVLSFSTSVEVATNRGATVYPFPSRDSRASNFAKELGAILAGDRDKAEYSLSPDSFLKVPPGTRIVLPSPNGATLSLAAGTTPVLAGCLRNAAAVSNAVQAIGSRALIVPAGERWHDGSLRPSLEDWLGAGAILDSMSGPFTPEARACRDAFRSSRADLQSRIWACTSGQELVVRGFPGDVELASELDVGDVVPVLRDGAYQA